MSSLATSQTGATPALRTGDRMSPAEFDRIYEHLHDVRAELIDGVVNVASPVRTNLHGRNHAYLITIAVNYLARVGGLEVSDNGSLLLPGGSRVQPDICLFRQDASAYLNTDGYIEGVPEFVAEVAASTSDFDLNQKFRLYERSGISEYLVWRASDEAIDFFRLEDGRYVRVEPHEGIHESATFPGLKFHVPALLAGDIAEALAALDPA